MKRRVVKLGGSLLELRELAAKLKFWLHENGNMQNVIVVGGGDIANVIRRLDRTHGFLSQQSHELACKSMRLTASIVSYLIGEADLCRDEDELENSRTPTVIFDSSEWILQQPNVPVSWDFTSDSIAARLATVLNAEELVLIKSRMGYVNEAGFVDGCFAEESKSVKSIRVCTLSE